jgi:putative ABC transport system substrate-binding protein
MAIDVGRREFITFLGGTAAAWSLAARAAGHLPRIGVLDINSAETNVRNLAAFRDGLRGLGYIEGSTVDIDYRYSDGDTDRLPALAQELVQFKPDVVLAVSVSPARAVKRIAPTMPIVCPSFGDAFVPSLAASFAHGRQRDGHSDGGRGIVREADRTDTRCDPRHDQDWIPCKPYRRVHAAL